MPAYLDHAATTPMRPEAVEAMLPLLGDQFGNPSGSHAIAREAKKVLEAARDVVAECLGVTPGEIVFTGSGTEADNLGVTGAHANRPGPVLCSAVEHHAVLHPTEALRGQTIPVTAAGVVDLDALDELLTPETSVVAVMLANNEVGAIQPVAEVAARVKARSPRAVVVCDAVQAFPWLDVADLATAADLVAISGHKFGGPKGVGALVVRRGNVVHPIIHGGGQERDRRSGTYNVAGIVALAAAMKATVAERDEVCRRVGTMRDRLADGLLAAVPDASETGDRRVKIAGNCHVTFGGVEAEALLVLLDAEGVFAAAGSACSSGAVEPSHVLVAMGVPHERAAGSLRLSLGRSTTDADIDLALRVIPAAVERLRADID